MLYSCPNHDLPIEIIIKISYARLSHNDQTMLDSSYSGSFMKTIELNATLNIGKSTKEKSQVYNLSLIVLNLL